MAFAELVARSNFTFLEGASHPEELVTRAHALGLETLGLCDRDSLAGIVRAHVRAKELGLKLVVGAELTFVDRPPLALLAADAEGYGNLCELVSIGRLSAEKGRSYGRWEVVDGRHRGLWAVDLCSDEVAHLAEARALFGDRLSAGVWNHMTQVCPDRLDQRVRLATRAGVPLLATNLPAMHVRARQPLQDVLTCIRLGTDMHHAGRRLFPNAERILKGEGELARLMAGHPEWLARSAEVAAACRFSLDTLTYRFPEEDLAPGETPDAMLHRLVQVGLARRYPQGTPADVAAQVVHELGMVRSLGFAGYFLTVWDIVRFARERGILCQGRGSAANSVVCYALGITSIDPVRMGLLFERFISQERGEPPDIDVDFEHERREEVLQYVYGKHGRDRAAMVANVICYRGRSALRDVGKAMGLSLDQVDRLARTAGAHAGGPDPEALRHSGLVLDDPLVRHTLRLSEELQDFPRHLGIHSGGFVVTHDRLARLVPLENASMEGRTVIQWDKDDAAAAGLLKIDLLSLGMLSMLARAFGMIRTQFGRELSLDTIPAEDPAVYDMLCEADSVGVFQIESRAQMNMLPRMKPRCFYDLVVEVAIIRPGPIQGGMVHPYLRRRDGLEQVTYPHPAVRAVLEKTLGVTLFQEQGMKLAVAAAGFSPGEADELRRAMTHKRSRERLASMKEKLVSGMAKNGIGAEAAENIFQQLLGFSGYGFPESHAASFALLVYASAWLKRHYPGVFAACLLNAQPMGFYAPHTLVEDARRHGVPPRPIDVFFSDWETTLEEGEPGEGLRESDEPWRAWVERDRQEGCLALRLGLNLVRGLRRQHAARIIETRTQETFRSVEDFAKRTALPGHVLVRLAAAGALEGFGLGRRETLWHVQSLAASDSLFAGLQVEEPGVAFDEGSGLERLMQDYETTGVSSRDHPMALLRPQLAAFRLLRSDLLQRMPGGRPVRVGGLVIVRQRPQTAKGVVFITLEDECGFANLVVAPDLWDRV
ncbi:MAG: polymerase alpha subunit, partial [Pseudomonadota bacterium]